MTRPWMRVGMAVGRGLRKLAERFPAEEQEESVRIEELTDEAIDYIVGHMDTSVVTKWELDFFASVSGQWALHRELTDTQKIKLGEIWDNQP